MICNDYNYTKQEHSPINIPINESYTGSFTVNSISVSPQYNVSTSGSPVVSPNGILGVGPGNVLVSNDKSSTWAPSNIPNDLEVSGKLIVGGKNIIELFSKIEERLAILHTNPELESRWEQLKALKEQYQALEQELIEKEKMWEILGR